ncbi:MAG: S-layer homology domain-containing protein [Clostridiales bacterium]|jgi:hypothetical protein|nr:S-layer homology domain-containing protein [Clostridiales bacterium]
MKRLLLFLTISIGYAAGFSLTAYALPGDMGFFGGISEGRRLPKTTETLLSGETRIGADPNETRTFPYKEIVFLTGRPVEFTGMLEVSGANGALPNTVNGNYTQMLRVYPSASSGTDVSINRNIVFTVNYHREGSQLIKDFSVRDWTETISVGEAGFNLDREQSGFDISILEHETPGIGYYRGDVSARSVYTTGGTGGEAERLTLDTRDSFYGYACAWSGAEAHRMDAALSGNNWQMMYQIRPCVSTNKTLWYTENEPSAISFDGNYKEVLQNQSGLRYNILQAPIIFPDQPAEGGASIPTRNTFEQLIAADVGFLKGHPAMEDIRELYSMRVLDGDPTFFKPEQAITRAQFVSALAKAVKLPVEIAEAAPRGRRALAPPIVFPDVQPNRPDYPYLMAAYRNGVAVGRDDGAFYSDSLLERQEAFVILIRALGIGSLGSRPAQNTHFADDSQIAWWARQSLNEAYRLGLIKPEPDGRIRPREYVSKAEAAAMLRELVDYMRVGIASDYAEHIVNYVG